MDFDTTKNLFIEGDNLDALKLLQETYLGKVKLIYIDPPYNTGSDLLYEDDFGEPNRAFQTRSEQRDETGNRLVANLESNGRFHSDWLSMIYPRIKLARNLLTETGAIFISIGDDEVCNLRKLCDEVFGEHNFVSQVTRVAKRTSDKGTHFRPTKDHVLVYAKDIALLPEFGIRKIREEGEYNLNDESGRKYKKSGASLYQPSLDSRPNQRYYIEAPDGSLIIPPGNVFPEEKKDASKVRPLSNGDKVWRWSVDTYLAKKHLLIFTEGSAKNPLLDENGKQSKWNIYPKVFFDEDVEATLHPEDVIYEFPNSQGTKELNALALPFSFAKPTGLIAFLLGLLEGKDAIVADFFAGSSTTAHAAMKLNAEDNGNRRFVMVQFPEPCDANSEAAKAGYATIDMISKERIRRAGKQLKEENATNAPNLDVGFRVLKIDTSNMEDVYYAPDEVKQADLVAHTDNIKPDRTPEDLLFQVLVDWGVDLVSAHRAGDYRRKEGVLRGRQRARRLFRPQDGRRPREGTGQAQAVARRLPRQQLRQRQREDQRGADLQAPQPRNRGQIAVGHEAEIQTAGFPDGRREGGSGLLRRPTEEHAASSMPSIRDVWRTAARWLCPGWMAKAFPMTTLALLPGTCLDNLQASPAAPEPSCFHGAERDRCLRRQSGHRDGDRHGQDLLLHQDDVRAEQGVRLEQVHRRRAEHRDPRRRAASRSRSWPNTSWRAIARSVRYFIYNSKQLHNLESFSSDAGHQRDDHQRPGVQRAKKLAKNASDEAAASMRNWTTSNPAGPST